jgi:hypothetical protein
MNIMKFSRALQNPSKVHAGTRLAIPTLIYTNDRWMVMDDKNMNDYG